MLLVCSIASSLDLFQPLKKAASKQPQKAVKPKIFCSFFLSYVSSSSPELWFCCPVLVREPCLLSWNSEAE